jgi:hypothetical protein
MLVDEEVDVGEALAEEVDVGEALAEEVVMNSGSDVVVSCESCEGEMHAVSSQLGLPRRL